MSASFARTPDWSPETPAPTPWRTAPGAARPSHGALAPRLARPWPDPGHRFGAGGPDGTGDPATVVDGRAARLDGPEPVDREALIARYGHLVKYVVGRLGAVVPGVFDHEDAMQVGAIGLLRAIDAYRPEAEASFESYAIVRIRGAILDAVRALDVVGRAGREAGRSIAAAIAELQAELGRSPTEIEVAARLGLSVERYRQRLARASLTTVSLDALDGRAEDEPSPLFEETVDPEAPDPEDVALRRSEIETLAREIERLSDRQRTVLGLYYQNGLTFREIGALLGVTESRVCQIHTEAVLTLRARLLGREPGWGRRQDGRNDR